MVRNGLCLNFLKLIEPKLNAVLIIPAQLEIIIQAPLRRDYLFQALLGGRGGGFFNLKGDPAFCAWHVSEPTFQKVVKKDILIKCYD